MWASTATAPDLGKDDRVDVQFGDVFPEEQALRSADGRQDRRQRVGAAGIRRRLRQIAEIRRAERRQPERHIRRFLDARPADAAHDHGAEHRVPDRADDGLVTGRRHRFDDDALDRFGACRARRRGEFSKGRSGVRRSDIETNPAGRRLVDNTRRRDLHGHGAAGCAGQGRRLLGGPCQAGVRRRDAVAAQQFLGPVFEQDGHPVRNPTRPGSAR